MVSTTGANVPRTFIGSIEVAPTRRCSVVRMRRAPWISRAPLIIGVGALLVGATALAALDRIDGAAVASQRAVRGDRITIDPDPPAATARYRVSFIVTWGSATHPGTLPPGSHVSPAVVATHAEPGDLFAVGTAASAGIESMAEVGATSTLVAELRADPTVGVVTTGRRIDGPGVDVFELDVRQEQGLVSLVSMLAPSPDWFVGVGDVALLGADGWADRVEIPLGDYDAGTDSGSNFTSPNADTRPAQPIGGPRDAAFVAAVAEGSFGRVVIERIG